MVSTRHKTQGWFLLLQHQIGNDYFSSTIYKAYRFEESFYVHASLEGKFLRLFILYLLITKRGRNIVVAWHGLRGRQDCFHSWVRFNYLNFSTSSREVRTRTCLFCHHQIGEDCWVYRFNETKQEEWKQEGLNVIKDETSYARKRLLRIFLLFSNILCNPNSVLYKQNTGNWFLIKSSTM